MLVPSSLFVAIVLCCGWMDVRASPITTASNTISRRADNYVRVPLYRREPSMPRLAQAVRSEEEDNDNTVMKTIRRRPKDLPLKDFTDVRPNPINHMYHRSLNNN